MVKCAYETTRADACHPVGKGDIMKKRGIWSRRAAIFCCCAALLGLTACGSSTDTDTSADVGTDTEAAVDTSTDTGSSAVTIEVTTYPLPTEAEEAGVYVQPVEGIDDDFIRGVDLSSILVEENSGVVYYNEDGEVQDIFMTLAQNGVNYIRVRVWNDPYDEDGNGYGGGNCDATAAATIGARAAAYGMKLCVDFHYSDFWADPNKQYAPKAWEDMTIEEKSEALYTYTKESLEEIIAAGAQVGIVQIGNEINNGLAGDTDWTKKRQLLQAGSKAVREVAEETGQDIQIAVHFTDVSDQDGMLQNAQKLEDKEIDYDIFAVSYYTYWHGNMENLTETLKIIADTYGKKVMVAETAYPYTEEDGDGFANSVSVGDLAAYPATVQGQVNAVRDVFAATAAVGDAALGVFYWEPAWIPVGVCDWSSSDADAVYASNQEIWEEYGSGWASSYSVEYDPKDAGIYYGGCSWDNQAMFDFYGHPLESLKVFKYLQCGTIVEQSLESVEQVTVEVNLGGTLTMPETGAITLNDRSVIDVPVDWDENDISVINVDEAGTYLVTGTYNTESLADTLNDDILNELAGMTVYADVEVQRFNLVQNSSFEDEDVSMWNVTCAGSNITDIQKKESDAYSGEMALHFYSTDAISFTVEQTFTDLEPGTYMFGAYMQGGDVGSDPEIYIYAETDGERLTQDGAMTGWVNWDNPEISEIVVGESGELTIGVSVSCAAYGWGTLDDFYLYWLY